MCSNINEHGEKKDGKQDGINLFLYFSALSVNIATFGVGGAFAWSSPAIPRLNGNVDPEINPLEIEINSKEESWIASLLPLGAAASCFVSGYLADKIGRKCTLLLTSIPMITGFLLKAFASNIWCFYLGRVLNGFSAGTVFSVIPMYVGEIAEDCNRGILGCFFMVFLTSGILFTYSVGFYVSLKVLSLINIIAPVIFLFVFGFLVPESPYYLIAKNKEEKARKSLMKLRRSDIDSELPQIVENVSRSFANKAGIKDLFTERYLFKTLCITGGLVVFQQLTGINLVIFYMESIFEDSGSSISSGLSTITVGAVRVISSVASSSLADRLGRRILLLTSSAGMSLSLVCFATYCHVRSNGYDVKVLYWLPMVSIICYILSFAFGYGPIPFALIGEVFPPHVKSAAATSTICLCFVVMFCVTTFFPYLIDGIGMSYTFTMLTLSCSFAGIFVYHCVPETKGKSLEDIQEILK